MRAAYSWRVDWDLPVGRKLGLAILQQQSRGLGPAAVANEGRVLYRSTSPSQSPRAIRLGWFILN